MGLWSMLDALMCGMWIIVYSIVLISSIKNKYPAISPLFPALVLPWEITAVLYDIQNRDWAYAEISHISFVFLNTGILIVILFYLHWYNLPQTLFYFLFVFTSIFIHYKFIFQIEMGQLFSSFLVTGLAVLSWTIFMRKRTIPLNGGDKIIAGLKLSADSIGGALYFKQSNVLLKTIIILLIFFHVAHFAIVMQKGRDNYRRSEGYDYEIKKR